MNDDTPFSRMQQLSFRCRRLKACIFLIHPHLQYLETVLRYAASGSNHVKNNDIVRALKGLLDDEGGDIMATLAEQWIEQGIEKGVAQGIKQGMVEDAREMIQEAIASRFGTVPENIAREIEGFDDRERLRILLRQAVVCSDLAVFRKALKEVKD